MQWMFLTMAILLQTASSISLTLSARQQSDSRRRTALWAALGLLSALLSYMAVAFALKDLSLLPVFGLWAGAGVVNSALVLLLFHPQVWNWKRNFYLLCVIVGMLGLMFVA